VQGLLSHIRASVLGVAILLGTSAPVHAQDIVVHPGVPSQSIGKKGVRALFGMHLHQWKDGTPVQVFVLPDDHPSHIAFCKHVLGVFPHQIRRAWDRLIYSGTGQGPVVVKDEQEMLQRVASTPGAIGYLFEENTHGKVRVLRIE
jgi:ABC-type phosphate transport system substrate-binding protein